MQLHMVISSIESARMDSDQVKVDKIVSFADKGRKLEKHYDENPLDSDAIQSYNRRVENTIRSLQEHVKRQEDMLRQLRASKQGIEVSGQEMDPKSRLSQVRRVKKAYDSLLQSEPGLPAPDSPLPCLIALRETARVNRENKASIANLKVSLPSSRQQLENEQNDLNDARRFHDGLKARIQEIRRAQSEHSVKSPSELANEYVRSQRSKTQALQISIQKLREELNQFIEQHLASQLAAEDLGGPVVGDVMQIPDSTLEAGYTSHGKPKKPKTSAGQQEDDDDDPRQQRIDSFLRPQRQGDDTVLSSGPTNKRTRAATSMHELMNSLLESGASYVDIPQESAASRFLVRAKVAQLHPRDARRIRLIDFGRNFED